MLRKAFSVGSFVVLGMVAFGQGQIGKPASEDKIKSMDITVFPDGRGLPAGSGTAAKGKDIFKAKCAVCHNDKGEGRTGQYPALVGGIGSINTPKPVKTVGSYWPYATTVFDYIRRAMPLTAPGSLDDDQVYALTAFLLAANGVLPQDTVLDREHLRAVRMPNVDGFFADPRPGAP